MNSKKGVMGEIIQVFVLILIISILAGLTFIFTASIKTQAETISATSLSVINETGWINGTGYTLSAENTYLLAKGYTINLAINSTDNATIPASNYTINTNTGVISNTSARQFSTVKISYSFSYTGGIAYTSINQTESAGYTIITFLPLVFLALIFGAILMVVLKVILPYINLGKSVQGF